MISMTTEYQVKIANENYEKIKPLFKLEINLVSEKLMEVYHEKGSLDETELVGQLFTNL